MPKRIEAAVREEAEANKEQAQARTPVKTGVLRDSAQVISDGNTAHIVYTAPYAAIVHEDLDAHHRNGEAKFLERTMNDSVAGMAQRLAERIHLEKVKP